MRFGTKLYRQIVGIPMGTNCAPLVAVLFYTATKEISWILLTITTKLVLSRLFVSGVRLYDGLDFKLHVFILVGWGWSFLSVAWPTGVQLVFLFCLDAQGSPSSGSILNL